MSTLDELWMASGPGEGYAKGYGQYVASLIDQLDFDVLAAIADTLESACREDRTIFCIGNGGSAATASHFVTDLAWAARTGSGTPPRAVSLCANESLMTAIANDAGYEKIFLEQLRGLFRPGDVLVAISASGNSPNLLQAIEYVNAHEGIAIGLVGFDGGRMKDACRLCLHVVSRFGDYEPVEDVHHVVCHMVASDVKRRVVGPFDSSAAGGVAQDVAPKGRGARGSTADDTVTDAKG